MRSFDTHLLEEMAFRLLRGWLTDPALVDQLSAANVIRREATTAGVTLDFNAHPIRVSRDPGRFEVSVSGEMSELKAGFGGLLFIEGGRVRMLEFFPFGEQWPETPTNVRMSIG
jgi:hypothetical protein